MEMTDPFTAKGIGLLSQLKALLGQESGKANTNVQEACPVCLIASSSQMEW